MKYRLVFKGELTGKNPQDQCLVELTKLFGRNQTELVGKLFRGRPIVVKTTSDRQVANRFVTAFEKAGARLHLEVLDQDAGPPPPVSAAKENISSPAVEIDPDTEVTRLRPAMRRPDTAAKVAISNLSEDDKTRQRPAVPANDDRSSKRRTRRRR